MEGNSSGQMNTSELAGLLGQSFLNITAFDHDVQKKEQTQKETGFIKQALSCTEQTEQTNYIQELEVRRGCKEM